MISYRDNAFGSTKVSLLVFKDGEIINLVRVIENEDGTYSPYNKEKPSSDIHTNKLDNHMSFFKKISEDMDMAIKMQMLKLKLKNMSIKKEMRNKKRQENLKESLEKLEEYENYEKDITNLLSYLETRKQLSTQKLEHARRKTFRDDEIDSEDEHAHSEIALKDKHRTKVSLTNFSQRLKSLHANCEKIAKTDTCKHKEYDEKRKSTVSEKSSVETDSILCKNLSERIIKPSTSRSYPQKFDQPISIIKEHAENENVSIEVPCSESLSLSARAELSRIHISEDSESIDLDDTQQDLWHIRQRDAIQHNKTYNVGLITKHIGLEHNYNIKNHSGDNKEILNNDFFENDFYNLSHFVSSPTTVPSYMSKENSDCDTFFEIGNSKSYNRLPLYGRQGKLNDDTNNIDDDYNTLFNLKDTEHKINYLQEIKTFENKKYENDSKNLLNETSTDNKTIIKSIHNNNSKSLINKNNRRGDDNNDKDDCNEKRHDEESLGAVSKKTMRCGHCKKRLTIVNIYNCRCGMIFCGQHRYSEAHNCKYDYKSEGKKILEQANPLVIAKKLDKI